MGSVLLRLLSRRGRYPVDDIACSGHLLCVTDRVPWSAVAERVHPPLDEFSEVQVLSPEEVQLFGAVALAVKSPAQYGHLAPAPLTEAVRIDVPRRLDLRSPSVRRLVAERAAALVVDRREELLHDAAPGNDYEHAEFSARESAIELIRAISPRDRLSIRGLAKFLVARALSRERWFLEEAGIAAFTSLEAALTIIRQHLEVTTGRSASYDDAYGYLRVTFPTGEPLVRWLRELYDLRTIAVHPSSRFGEFWAPPMDADHCLEAIDWLIPIYRHILLQEIPEADAA